MRQTCRMFILRLIQLAHRMSGFLLWLAAKVGLFSPYQPIPDLAIGIAPHREAAVRERWKVIRSELPETPSSVLDVGCNVGFYVIESAKLQHFVTGIDTIESITALTIVKNALGLRNVMPVAMKINPENVRSLPSFDVVIILQLFHHLCAAYGDEGARDILRSLWCRTRDKLILEVEPSGQANEPLQSPLSPAADHGEDWIREFFTSLGSCKIRVIYRDENRRRSVFVIERERGPLSEEPA